MPAFVLPWCVWATHGCLRHWFEDLERTHEVFVDGHHRSRVVELTAVIGRREYLAAEKEHSELRRRAEKSSHGLGECAVAVWHEWCETCAYGHELPICEELISIFYNLVSAAHLQQHR